MEQLELEAARYRLGLQRGQSLRDLGVALLSDGHDAAVRLAIVDDLTMASVGPVFERVCRELKQPIPSVDQAIDIVTRALLGDIAQEAIAPEAGLKRLMDDVVRPHIDDETARFAGESRGLQHLVGAYWSYDELRGRPTEISIDGKFGDEALSLLDQQVIGFARDWLDQHRRTNSLRMAAVGPSDEDPDAMLWADEPAVRRLIAALRSLEDHRWSVDLCEPPMPGPRLLRRLVLLRSDEPVRVEVTDDELLITGTTRCLHDLADFLSLYVEHNDLQEPGMHTHVDREWSIAADWLAPDTTPLRVCGWVREG
jgi:hypothetical protein